MVRSIVRGTSITKNIDHGWKEDSNPEAHKKGVMNWEIPKIEGPLSRNPEPKSRFMPSKIERKMVNRLVYAVKMGWIDLDQRRNLEEEEKKKAEDEFDENEFLEDLEGVGDVWGEEKVKQKKGLARLEAPGFALPDHDESFNPAPEFLEDSLNRNFFIF